MSLTLNQPDRVSFSYGTKVPGEERYSSVDLHMSYSTDIMDGETADEAMARARRFVLDQLNEKAARSQQPRDAAAPAARPSSPMLFDPENPMHRDMAAAHFEIHRVTTEKRRKFIAFNFLAGKPLDQVGPLIRAEVEAFKKSSASIFPIKRRTDRP